MSGQSLHATHSMDPRYSAVSTISNTDSCCPRHSDSCCPRHSDSSCPRHNDSCCPRHHCHYDHQINNNNASGRGYTSDSGRGYTSDSFSLSETSDGSVIVTDRLVCRCQGRGEQKQGRRDKVKAMKVKRLVALIAVFVIYVSIGAAVFNVLEAGAEQDRKDVLQDKVERFLLNNSCVSRADLYRLLRNAVEDSEIVYYVVENKTHLDRWDFSGAFGFVVSVVTTIGFGNLAPFTSEGKAVCVVYAIFGIPLTLLVLGGIGEKMASFVYTIRRCQNPYCHHTPRVNRMLNIFYVVIMGVAVIFIAPAGMLTYVEQWHFLESLYFAFTTLSTIGFGDYVIGIHETRFDNVYVHEFYEVFAYVWILLGLAYLSLVYRYITDTMVAKAHKVERSTIKRLGVARAKQKFQHKFSSSFTLQS
ncbi:potassium channel subfamily K member 16-like isoform X2 [Physella acuta]|uniref:potassium channel subfamily K member 16-like isoform X2 n=1 Tax=Physella acuta TaxID=109671 RepID=UPI0027DDAF6B|nr:potassium channel subfamily K member 16-like isoform X2 [Physella acuta]